LFSSRKGNQRSIQALPLSLLLLLLLLPLLVLLLLLLLLLLMILLVYIHERILSCRYAHTRKCEHDNNQHQQHR
jgi:Flp pilus assembly protein TadB